MKTQAEYYERCLDRVNNYKHIVKDGNQLIVVPDIHNSGSITLDKYNNGDNETYEVTYIKGSSKVSINLDQSSIKSLYSIANSNFQQELDENNSKILESL